VVNPSSPVIVLNHIAYQATLISVETRELLLLEQVLDELRTQREISRRNWMRLHEAYGDRFTKAWGLMTERRIKKYTFKPSGRIIWIAVGNSGEYLIYPHAGYCGCSDFYFRVLDRETPLCYHLLAQKLAEALHHYDDIPEDDEAYRRLMEIWKHYATAED
jgi:predicted nucleic acid-binding Zn finger protein